MPELPEVETVRRGLLPAMEGQTFSKVTLHRADLRFPFPPDFVARLEGRQVVALKRRAKFLVLELSSGEHLIMHLGMSGRFSVGGEGLGQFHHQIDSAPHTHVIFQLSGPLGETSVTYADPRRFGYMDLVEAGGLETSRHVAGLGPEPLSSAFTPESLQKALSGKATPLKSALLDQKVVAGLGNIYVCEALFRAGLSPRRLAKTVGPKRATRLVADIKQVLAEALEAGGSSLRDFASASGEMGYFQHRFDVYDQEGQECVRCGATVKRITQSGRSTFFCSNCQR